MDDQPLIDVRGLSKLYGRVRAVHEVSFHLNRGEVLGLLGPNGAGKSTTMQMLCGTLAADAGTVKIDGVDLSAQPRKAKANIGYLPEIPPLYSELTVGEFLRYAARIRGVVDAKKAVELAVSRCGLTDVHAKLIGNLSKGYQQRVGIAQAIVHQPPVVVLDEPTVGLDPNQIREIRELIRELGGVHSVLLSTHILPEVQAVCDRVLIMHRGRLVLDQPLLDLSGRGKDSTLLLRCKRPPLAAELSKLQGVSDVHDLGGGRFRIRHVADASVDESVAAAAVHGDWGLAELYREQSSLEEVFVRLTTGDDLPTDLDSNRAQQVN